MIINTRRSCFLPSFQSHKVEYLLYSPEPEYGLSYQDRVRVWRTVSLFLLRQTGNQDPDPQSLMCSYSSLGATAITLGLPILLYFFTFACNDEAGCPIPSLLNPRSSSWEKLKSEIKWPQGGIRDLGSWEATGVVLAYYLLSMILYKVLPAQEVYGTKLVQNGRPLKYRFNGKPTSRIYSVDARRS